MVVYLHVPWQVSMTLTHNKADRKYLKGKRQDIAEADVNHRVQAENVFRTCKQI
jgi:hypothetical protein